MLTEEQLEGLATIHILPQANDPGEVNLTSLLRAVEAAAMATEREECAKLCESRQDYKEEARAILAASAALNDGDGDETLRRLRHESMVRFMNNALAFAAADIRKRSNV